MTHGIVTGITGIGEYPSGQDLRCGVARDHAQMYVTLLVLKERIVKVVGTEGLTERVGCHTQLRVQLRPLLGGQVRDGFAVAAQGEKSLP
jgi:hypothetical protein